MRKVILMSPGISIFRNKESAEISTLYKIEENEGKFSQEDKCIMFLIDEENSKKAAALLKEEIEKRFNIQVEFEIIEDLSIENISNNEFLELINDFLSVVSKKILSIGNIGTDMEVYVSLTSGYKIISTTLSLIALIHNFKIVYLHENSKNLLYFPQIDIELGIDVWLKYWKMFYSLSIKEYTIDEFYNEFGIKERPKAIKPFIYTKEKKIFLTSLGKLLEKRATELYSDDKLGIKNVWKRKFIEDVFLRQLSRKKNNPVVLMELDIDHFKKINDTYGHDIGDKVLYQYAKVILELLKNFYLKEKDIFIFPPQLVRWGGEEFIVIYQAKYLRENFISDFAEKIREKIEDEKFVNSIQITTSIGVSYGYIKDNPIDDIEKIFKQADINLYEAKSNGRNRVVLRGLNEWRNF
ncbi:diguanylate cyclase [Persephonella sp.]